MRDESPNQHQRPGVNPQLSYDAGPPIGGNGGPPSGISAVVAEAVVFLSNTSLGADSDGEPMSQPPSDAAGRNDSTMVFNAVFRLLDSMTTRRLTSRQLSDGELTRSSVDTDEPDIQFLDEADHEFQLANPELEDPSSNAILPDGSYVSFNPSQGPPRIPDPRDMDVESDTNFSIWNRLVAYAVGALNSSGAPDERPTNHESRSNRLRPKKILTCDAANQIRRSTLVGPIKSNKFMNFQGYEWPSYEMYRLDQNLRKRHLCRQLMKTRQFLERRPSRRLRSEDVSRFHGDHTPEFNEPLLSPYNNSKQIDVRRIRRRMWFKLYGISPRPQIFFKLKYFHTKPCPIFDHFQLKNLLQLPDGKGEVYYLSHCKFGDRMFTCVMSYNLQNQRVKRALGPWAFNIARNLYTGAGPLYHSLSSISFESRYLFSLSVSQNYIATSDTSSSILLANRGADIDYNEADDGRSTPCAGKRLLCQRVSAQPLQITNSIVLIESAKVAISPVAAAPEVADESPIAGSTTSDEQDDDLIRMILKQAEQRGKILFTTACSKIEQQCCDISDRVAFAHCWSKLKQLALAEARGLRRIRSLFSPSNSPMNRENAYEEAAARMASQDPGGMFLPTPADLTVLTAGNDKTLCEYRLEETICGNQSHATLDNSETVCKTRLGLVSGFSACIKCPKSNVRKTRSLRLVKSWSFPYCLNKIALHPNKNLMILVGDSPQVILAARRSNVQAPYFAKRGCVKNALTVLDVHQDASFAAAWHPDGYMFATGSDDRTIAIWNLRNLLCPQYVIQTVVTACRSLEFSPDGKYLLSCESEDAVVIYSVEKNFEVAQKVPFFGGCTGAAFSADSNRIVIGIGAAKQASGVLELSLNKLPYHAVHFKTFKTTLVNKT